MKGLVDRPASEVTAGDTIVEPYSGVISRVLSAGVVGQMVTLDVVGVVANNKVFLSLPTDRLLRALPRVEPVTPSVSRGDERHPHRPGG